MKALSLTVAVLACLASPAAAQQARDDGYCDYVEGVASSEAAVQYGPEVFGSTGYVEQGPGSVTPDQTTKGLRFIGGVRLKLSGIYTGVALQGRAKADCRRHKAFDQVQGETASRALAARLAVLDEAVEQGEKLLQAEEADFAARRSTAQEATATRVRVEELRALAADDKRQLSGLPAPTDKPLAGALAAYREADADIERYEAKLRRAQAIDVSVRVGFDDYSDRQSTSPPYFAVLYIGVNLGAFFQGAPNARAAAGRKRLVRSGRGLGLEGTVDQLRATIEIETKRAKETEALVDELERQLEALAKIGGDESRRYKQTVWFELVKARAQHAYLSTHVASMREVLGGNGP
jgi:hypothetical protein